jgi:hypothetical protein
MHGACSGWFSQWAYAMRSTSRELSEATRYQVIAAISGLRGSYLGRQVTKTALLCFSLVSKLIVSSENTMDSAVYTPGGAAWPSIALENGYTETHTELVEDARQLLVGTEGHVSLVIIIKMEPLSKAKQLFKRGL